MKIRKVSDEEIAEIQRLFRYEDGKVFWRADYGRRIKAGDRAGTLDKNGYRKIVIKKRPYGEHRLVWILIHGKAPADFLDHINGARGDNHIENLREATHAENLRAYRILRKNTSSKYRGVFFCNTYGKFHSRAQVHRKNHHFGYFTCEVEAARAYDKGALKLGFAKEALNFK